jgi:aspartate-semialdehyde dehydrogenase
MKKKNVGILGARGLVGQRMIEFLKDHPYFEIKKLFSREINAGNPYFDIVDWKCETPLPENIASIKMSDFSDMEEYIGLDFVFSALPADAAKDIEEGLRKRGQKIISNASSHRLDTDVPLLIPEINFSSIDLIKRQMEKYSGGFIATNPNCSVIGILLSIFPIHEKFKITDLSITTMQAISGAGIKAYYDNNLPYNLIPNISGEEEKIKQEIPKVLGKDDINLKVKVNRVSVIDGHMFSIFFKTKEKISISEIETVFNEYEAKCGKLSSIPEELYKVYIDDKFMPQAKSCVWEGRGMTTCIGRIEKYSDTEFSITSLSNNIVRGASGGTILIAESICEKGKI